MKILRLFIVLMLLGALIQTTSVPATEDNLTLLDEDEEDTDKTETKDKESDHEEDEHDSDEKDDHDEDSEDEKDEKEHAFERKLKIKQEDDKFKVESELKLGDKKDKIEIEFKLEDKAEIKLKYKTESDSEEVKFKYRVSFERVIEYWDIDKLGFNDDKETLSEMKFKEWNQIQYVSSNVSGVEVYTITATTSDGVFSLVLRLSTSILDLGNSTLTPNSVKIDVIINDYPYTQINSSLAVKVKIKTESKVEVDDETIEEVAGFAQNEAQVGIGDLFGGFFSWAETAEADGVTIDVLSSTLSDSSKEDHDLDENETSQKLYFSFIATNASEIVWDPKVGVISEGTQQLIQSIEEKYGAALSDGADLLPGFGIWTLVISLSVLSILQFRKRKAMNR